MSQDSDFFDQRAKDASELAGHAILDNVRDRELRSAAAWRAMADRARRVEKSRQAATLAREQDRLLLQEAADLAAEPVAESEDYGSE
ncbi:MAG: hypothetical protein WA842_01105 [Croceibacterium sp.]